jgi:hypothetical protein
MIGKSSVNGPCSIAILNYRGIHANVARHHTETYRYRVILRFPWCSIALVWPVGWKWMKHVMPNSGGYDTAAQTEPKDRRKVSLLGSRAATWVIHGHFMSCLNTFMTTAGTLHLRNPVFYQCSLVMEWDILCELFALETLPSLDFHAPRAGFWRITWAATQHVQDLDEIEIEQP